MQTTNEKFKNIAQRRFGMAIGVSFLFLFSGLSLAQQSNREKFPSAEKACGALFAAVQSDDEHAIERILGGDEKLVGSGDGAADRADRETFLEKYSQMHRVVQEPDGTWQLYIGAENWPFPVPLVSKNGAWFFDGDAGAKEILFRRIGENEESLRQTCGSLSGTEQPPSDILHGYYFRKLAQKGGGRADEVILIAYPAEYRSSGVMTFAVTSKHEVFEKDLGPQTASIAKTMSASKVDRSWRRAE
jgi:hypothetical protein